MTTTPAVAPLSAEELDKPVFEAWAREACNMPPGVSINWSAAWTKAAHEGWQAARRATPALTGAGEMPAERLLNRTAFISDLTYAMYQAEFLDLQAALAAWRTKYAADRAQQAVVAPSQVKTDNYDAPLDVFRYTLDQATQQMQGTVDMFRKSLYSATPQDQGAGMQVAQSESPDDVVHQLREYASNAGYSHNDYADTMRDAANVIEALRARFWNYDHLTGETTARKAVAAMSRAELQVEVFDLRAQLARQGQGEPVAEAMYWKAAGASGWSFKWLGETPADFTEIDLYASPAQTSAAPAGLYRWHSVDGKQHDTGRVVEADGSFFATTTTPKDAEIIANALNKASAAPGQARAAVPDVCADAGDEFQRFATWTKRYTKENPGVVLMPRVAWFAAKAEAAAMLAAAPEPATAAVPADYVRAGWFIYEGIEWAATSSDDPRATILYRKAEAAQPVEQPAEDARDAARWRETLRHIGGAYCDGGARFTLRYLPPIPEANIMKGSVAGHFIAAIDAAMQASKGATDGAVEDKS